MSALELRATPPVIFMMGDRTSASKAPSKPARARPVRKGLLIALLLSALVHVVWTLWPVDFADEPEGTVLTATLTEMPPPPVPHTERTEPAPPTHSASAQPRARPRPRPPVATAPQAELPADASREDGAVPASAERAAGTTPAITRDANTATVADQPARPAVALPPRVDLAYKVYLGTHGLLIGDATYRFEHDGDRYRIATVGQARGLAALIVRGTGKVESQGRITSDGLRPYEFAIERGSADRREVAFFDWDAGNVVLHDGGTAALEAPTYDPLTILWQPYFSPPGTGEQTFGIATTRKVQRYTLTLQAEETIAWRRGDIVTQRWYRRSDDGNTEAWFWLAPSMHYIPIKMRVTRTSRGTLEVMLDSIRADEGEAFGLTSDAPGADTSAAAEAEERPRSVDAITYGMPGSAMPAMRADELRGQ
jgi:hypothetical protein